MFMALWVSFVALVCFTVLGPVACLPVRVSAWRLMSRFALLCTLLSYGRRRRAFLQVTVFRVQPRAET